MSVGVECGGFSMKVKGPYEGTLYIKCEGEIPS